MDARAAWNKQIASDPLSPKPLLVIQGDQDTIVDWIYNLKFLEKKFPNATVTMIPGGKHQLSGERTEVRQQVFQLIDDALHAPTK